MGVGLVDSMIEHQHQRLRWGCEYRCACFRCPCNIDWHPYRLDLVASLDFDEHFPVCSFSSKFGWPAAEASVDVGIPIAPTITQAATRTKPQIATRTPAAIKQSPAYY